MTIEYIPDTEASQKQPGFSYLKKTEIRNTLKINASYIFLMTIITPKFGKSSDRFWGCGLYGF